MATLFQLNPCSERLIKYIINVDTPIADLRIKLFKNNITVDPASATFTPPTAGGYAPVTTLPGSWTFGLIGNVMVATYPTVTFTFSDNGGGETIYGVWIDDENDELMYAGNLDSPFVIPSGGGTLAVNVTLRQQNC